MSNNVAKDKRGAYYGIRHLSPWAIRHIRCLIDIGKTRQDLMRLREKVPEQFRQDFVHCIDYMIANPEVGVCINFDGDCRWQWSEDVAKRAAQVSAATEQ